MVLARLADRIEQEFPGRVDYNQPVFRDDGTLWTDFDVFGGDFVIEVSASGAKKVKQMLRNILPAARTQGIRYVAIYVPDASAELTRRMPAAVTVLRSEQEVIDWIKGLGSP